MPIINWNNIYICGIKEIDQHHHVLVDLINQLHDAMLQGKGSQEVGGIIDHLVEYTIFHFTYEEKLMLQYAYPEHPFHRTAHQNLTRKVRDFQAEFHAQKIGLSIRLIDFLKEWLTNHIAVEDKKFAAYLKTKGVQ